MKNKTLMVSFTVAASLFISSAFAQKVPVPVQVGSVKTSQPKAGGSEPTMMVQQIKPIISSGLVEKNGNHPIGSKPAITEQPVSKGIVAPVTFQTMPPGMKIVLPTEDVKPVLPSTIIKRVETKPVIATGKDNAQNTGPKLAQIDR